MSFNYHHVHPKQRPALPNHCYYEMDHDAGQNSQIITIAMLGTCCIPVNPITLELYIPFAVQPFLSLQLYDLSIHKFFLFAENEAEFSPFFFTTLIQT